MMCLLVRLLGLASLSLVLAGCVSPVERRYADEGQCRSYGFRPGTDAFAACLQNIDLERAADRRRLLDRPFYGGVGFGYRRGWY